MESVYLHILDYHTGSKVLSEKPMVYDSELGAYMEALVAYFFEAMDVAQVKMTEASKVGELLSQGDFQTFSVGVAEAFWNAIESSEDVKSCDLLCMHFYQDQEEYVAAVKLNLKTSYAHAVDTQDNVIINKIVKHHATLPFKMTKPDEGFVMALNTGDLWVKDKTITHEGHKIPYVSDLILGIKPQMTPKKAIQTLTKTAEKIIDKFDDNPIVKKARLKATIENMIDESGSVDARNIIGQCFDSKAEREAYQDEISGKGLDDAPWEVADSQKSKIQRTQRIKTSSGVEIVLPYAYVAREENLVIENGDDGTVSISLKNLGELL